MPKNKDKCHFCSKKKEQVKKLVVSQSSAICDDCVALIAMTLCQEGIINDRISIKSINTEWTDD